MVEQLAFRFGGHGGRRVGAGRRTKAGRRVVAHRAREIHRAYRPVHVTMRTHVNSLRSSPVFSVVRDAIFAANCARSAVFRVCAFSVQADHLHLLVEAVNHVSLVEGMRGLAIRLAHKINRLLGRRGALFAGRWHGHELKSPREVRNALVYVLANFRKHGHGHPGDEKIDVFSSTPYFRGFAEYRGMAPFELDRRASARCSPVVAARTWLLAVGWKRRGYVSVREGPRR